MSGDQTSTPKQRGSTGNGRTASNSKNKKVSRVTGAGDDSLSPNNDENNSSSSSGKKCKIFHYFGTGLSDACSSLTKDRTPEVSSVRAGVVGNGEMGKGGSGGSARSGIAGNGTGTANQGSSTQHAVIVKCAVGTVAAAPPASSPAPTPSWGKIVDPRRQGRWQLLRCVQDGGGDGGVGQVGRGRGNPTAWARRSYSVGYMPVFQDSRAPGIGSTSGGTWGWASQSQVFGGSRACIGAHPMLAGGIVAVCEDTGGIGGGDDGDTEMGRQDLEVEMELEDSSGDTTVEGTAGYRLLAGVAEKKGNRNFQARNFRIMHTWLSGTLSSTVTFPGRISFYPPSFVCSSSSCSEMKCSEVEPDETAAAKGDTQNPINSPSLLEVALIDRDGGVAAAFMTLSSMDPILVGRGDDAMLRENDPVVLALRLYHGASTWRRLSRRPTPRQSRQGSGSRVHPNNLAMAAATDKAEARAREDRARSDYESALALIQAGLAVSFADAGSRKSGCIRRRGDENFDGVGKGKGGGGCGGDGDGEIDELAALAIREVLTTAETRALAKGLGVSVSTTPTAMSERSSGGFGSRVWNRSETGGTGGGVSGGGGSGSSRDGSYEGNRRRHGRGGSDSKDEVCSAIEQWLSRPMDAAKRRARVARATQQASRLIGTVKGSSDRGGGSDDIDTVAGSEGVENVELVLRLADDVREAIHRIHVAFFAAARHGPHDALALLREDLASVFFGGADAVGCAAGTEKIYGDEEFPPLVERLASSIDEIITRNATRGNAARGADCSPTALPVEIDQAQLRVGCSHPQQDVVSVECGRGSPRVGGKGARGRYPPPAILSSAEIFSEFYRLTVLADDLDLAASSGDSSLAYRSLHEASTVLLPSGCPLCRRNRTRAVATGAERKSSRASVVEVAKRNAKVADGLKVARSAEAAGEGVMKAMDTSGAGFLPKVAAAPPTPHCDICELSARVVMRGVALMERDKDYDNAFHYLEILLQAHSLRLSVHRPRYWVRLVTNLGHKKRAMEALRACEKALAEASLLPTPSPSSPADAWAEKEAWRQMEKAAVLPLCESLPLLRRAARLAVPPLRWRKRPPPDLREARFRVLRLDLSWRRRDDPNATKQLPGQGTRPSIGGGGDGVGASVVLSTWDRRNERATSAALSVDCEGDEDQEGEQEDLEDGEGKGGSPAGATGADGCRSEAEEGGKPGIVPSPTRGTSLEDAVLDAMLAELGSEWTGLHAENSICLGLFALLCWDALFASVVPDSPGGNNDDDDDDDDDGVNTYHPFRSPFQSEPGDLMTVAFARRRCRALEGVFDIVEGGDAGKLLRRNWNRHYGKACTGLNWKLLPDGVEGWVTITCAIGPLPLSRLCRNLASNYWAWRHGLPDLFLWRKDAASLTGARASNVATYIGRKAGVVGGDQGETSPKMETACQWVEVKGPGDSLSCYQEAWIDTLVTAGADAVLLRVEDLSAVLSS